MQSAIVLDMFFFDFELAADGDDDADGVNDSASIEVRANFMYWILLEKEQMQCLILLFILQSQPFPKL